MGFYDRVILPRLIDCGCGMEVIAEQRRKVVPLARGTVLEIGIGTGHNLPFYDPGQVTRVIGLDPSEASQRFAAKRMAGLGFPVELIGLPGEEIPLADESVDTVLVTFSLCTIPDPVKALRGMRRVLKPGGKLLFSEHGAAPDAGVLKWQNRLNPLWGRLFGGCNLNRPMPALIGQGGFRIGDLHAMYQPKGPRFAGYMYWGSAEPA